MGSFSIHGTDFHFSFRVDEHGLSVSGKGHPSYWPSSVYIDTASQINDIPAEWTLYRAAEAAEKVSLYSLDVTDLKQYLDPDAVKITAKPVGVIRHYEGHPRQLYFGVFLPDQQFAHMWKLITLVGAASNFRYLLTFTIDDFMPRKIPDHPERISYDEWLAGRPCMIKDFVFKLDIHGADGLIGAGP